ncbi:unnamed protein product [Bubo scandiacus]
MQSDSLLPPFARRFRGFPRPSGPGKYIFSSAFGARAAKSHLMADSNSSKEEKQEATIRTQGVRQSSPKRLGSVQNSKQQANVAHISEIWTTHVVWVLYL